MKGNKVSNNIRSRPKQLDGKMYIDTNTIWAAVILLVAFGLIMIYSASGLKFINSEIHGNDSMYLLKRQTIFVLAGLVLCLIFQFINYSVLYKRARIIYLLGVGAILLLKSPLGVSAKGATRWLNILGIQFQVAELVKICIIIILAYMVQHYSKHLSKLKLLFRMWLVGGVTTLLLLKISNDLSSSLVILGITVGVTFVYTRSEKLHLVIAGVGVGGIGIFLWQLKNNMPTTEELENVSFRIGRIAAWLEPERYASSQGYQTLQALYAIGSGGFFGKGLGNSTQKISAIPEAQNDMIFSIICEELGIVGASLLILLIIYLCYQIFKVAMYSNNLFGSVLATGVLLHMSIQSFINIGVNVNLLPNTGIGLPFISYGGTAVFCQLIEVAIVLSVGRIARGCKSVNLEKTYKKIIKRKQKKSKKWEEKKQ